MSNKIGMKKKPSGGKKAGPPAQLLQQISKQQQKPQKEEEDMDDCSCSEEEHDNDFEHPDDAEDFEDYKSDGYHPVYLGERFKEGRYIVVQKLGWGHFSTVWLALDKETDTHVALKIQKSKKSYQESAMDELQLLGDLRKYEKSEKWLQFVKEEKEKHPESTDFDNAENYCVKLLDNFIHYGSHGKHYCSTFDIMGPNLLDLIQHFDDYNRTMKYWLIRLIARQCLIGLVYVHDICGMIHTDLKPENVMIQLNPDYFHQFLEQIQAIDKKPFSMLFLKKMQQKASKQNSKNDKKKDKKKKKKAAAAANSSQQTGSKEDPSQEEVSVSSQPIENIQVQQSQADQTLKDEVNENNNEQDYSKQIPLIPSESNGPEKKVEEKRRTSNQDEENSGDFSDDKSHESERIRDEDLYTLLWKKQIPIVLDKALKIKIVDFGNACWINKHFTNNIQTREYRAPEVILGMDYEQNTDVFSLACMIYELITNDYLFKPKKRSDTSKSEEHLALLQESLGRFKKEFALGGTRSREYFNKNGHLLHIKDIEDYPISKILIKEYEWDVEEAHQIEEFLLPMLNYNPKKRIQAREALDHPWLWQ